MKKITIEQLDLISKFLDDIEKYDIDDFQYESHLIKIGKIDYAAGALKLLLEFAEKNKFNDGTDNDLDYRYLYGHASLRTLLEFSKNNLVLVRRYLQHYPDYLSALDKEKLFNKTLSEMTGYEFEKYLKHVGIIK